MIPLVVLHALSMLPRHGGALCRGTEHELMRQKSHGTCASAVQQKLRFGCDRVIADDICCYNRHYAEPSGSYHADTSFVEELVAHDGPMIFYDSVSGVPLFVAPVGRSKKAFLSESFSHGWPSFRCDEVVWDNVRCLPDGEVVSTGGTQCVQQVSSPRPMSPP